MRCKMDQFDEMLKKRAAEEPFPIPQDYAGRVFQTCAGLEETKPRSRRSHRWAACAAAALALFIAVPNVSPAAAAAMAEVPLLGAIVEIITFRSYTYDDGHGAANVTVPELGGSGAAEEISQQVREYTDRLIARFEEDCKTLGTGYEALDVSSTVVTDTEQWFTLRVDAVQTQAGAYQFSRFYHIDKTTGETVSLCDLFRKDTDYVAVLSAQVRQQMDARMAENQEADYFPENFADIDPEQNFYWNEAGDLVLVFDEYAIAPGSMGMQEFTIPANVYEALLK